MIADRSAVSDPSYLLDLFTADVRALSNELSSELLDQVFCSAPADAVDDAAEVLDTRATGSTLTDGLLSLKGRKPEIYRIS